MLPCGAHELVACVKTPSVSGDATGLQLVVTEADFEAPPHRKTQPRKPQQLVVGKAGVPLHPPAPQPRPGLRPAVGVGAIGGVVGAAGAGRGVDPGRPRGVGQVRVSVRDAPERVGGDDGGLGVRGDVGDSFVGWGGVRPLDRVPSLRLDVQGVELVHPQPVGFHLLPAGDGIQEASWRPLVHVEAVAPLDGVAQRLAPGLIGAHRRGRGGVDPRVVAGTELGRGVDAALLEAALGEELGGGVEREVVPEAMPLRHLGVAGNSGGPVGDVTSGVQGNVRVVLAECGVLASSHGQHRRRRRPRYPAHPVAVHHHHPVPPPVQVRPGDLQGLLYIHVQHEGALHVRSPGYHELADHFDLVPRGFGGEIPVLLVTDVAEPGGGQASVGERHRVLQCIVRSAHCPHSGDHSVSARGQPLRTRGRSHRDLRRRQRGHPRPLHNHAKISQSLSAHGLGVPPLAVEHPPRCRLGSWEDMEVHLPRQGGHRLVVLALRPVNLLVSVLGRRGADADQEGARGPGLVRVQMEVPGGGVNIIGGGRGEALR
mmetsp:Transcript_111805/g.256301  ORF Transcript_111805/g.256301 Transcript_111805/m.256301 type:complete len:540 (+) Transcript_111805:328-1947(+)